jgi:branched-chain amino acid transport system substrate-binding protein
MKRRHLVLASPALLAGGLTAGLSSTRAAQPNVIRFGQSASLTGGQASYGQEVRDGIVAAFASVAKDGNGPQFELVCLDDGGTAARCRQNAQTLIESGVAGLIGFTSGAATETSLPLIEEARIALLGTASGNMGIRSDKLAMPYHVRAGYDTEFKRMVTYVKDFGMRRVGYVYLKDTSPANLGAMTAALDSVGVRLTESIAVDRNSKSFEAEAKRLLDARLDCVLFTTNAAPIIGVIDALMAGRYNGLYFSSSFAGQALIDAMAKKGQSVIMTQVVPRPNAMAIAVVNHCRQDLAALGTNARMGFTSLEGYLTGLVAIEAARAGVKNGALSRSRFKEALASLRIDLGGYKVDFTKGGAQGSQFVDVVAVDRLGRIIG